MANTYTNGITIDGIYFDVPMVSLKRKAEFLDKYAKRTNDGVLKRELTGVYFNYTLSIGFMNDVDTYNSLWEKLTEPIEFHEVTLPDSTGNYSFTAYISGVEDEAFRLIDGKNYFQGMTCGFIAESPARS